MAWGELFFGISLGFSAMAIGDNNIDYHLLLRIK
jgi:hypothetical protein